jgi:hypothetical protein
VFGKLLYRSKPGDMLTAWPKTPASRKMSELFVACKGRFGFDPPAMEAYRRKRHHEQLERSTWNNELTYFCP